MKKLIDNLTLILIKHIDFMLINRNKDFLYKLYNTGLSNKEELQNLKKTLQEIINPEDIEIKTDFIKKWISTIKIDYEVYDFIPFFNFFAKRILDMHFQTLESRANLINGIRSFNNYQEYELNLEKTVSMENVMKELLRELCLKLDRNSLPFILEQSNTIQSTFIQHFEGLLKSTSEELKYLNNNLEEKVKEKNKELIETLYNDKLTKLPNLNAFFRDSKVCDSRNTILFNIDGFRKINNIYGYSFADKVLINIAYKINKKILTCGNYKLYRYHGDWFIILETNKNSKTIESVYKHIIEVFEREPLLIEEESLSLSFTAGIARSFKEPIKYAELAYQKAKENKVSYEVYDDNINILESYKKYQHILKSIKIAIEKDLVVPYFQLIRDNENPAKRKYESLMRIKTPFDDVLSPFIFLDVAKDAKLYSSLSKIMMKKSIKTFENIDASFSINLEVEDVLNSSTMDYLYKLIKEHKVENKIIIEITESENINDFKEVSKIFSRFKKLGVKTAIDDFGTGYSNFSYLTEFDFDFIKIDGSLIKNIDTDENSYIIVETIVNFAKRLNKQIIAEFIDKDEVQKIIENFNIDYSQGYLFSEPSPSLI